MPDQMNTPEAKAKAQAVRTSLKSVPELMKSASTWWPMAQRSKIEQKLENMPESYRATYLKAMDGNSLAAAVKAHCLECVSWLRVEVRECTATDCPMFPYRPYQED
ncbi:unnamed protein product [marine sediment metagenome]|uniref:Uncharacterized protein n=1 Tax=marine sediment metagenome TaxID=412755 RepID=X0YCN3_9ZZZZ